MYSVSLHASLLTVDTPVDEQGETRRRSAALFGNEKIIEVVLALEAEGTATAQMIVTKTNIAHSMVRDAIGRLVEGGVVRALPKTGGRRSPQYYQPVDSAAWESLVAAVRAVLDEIRGASPHTTSDH